MCVCVCVCVCARACACASPCKRLCKGGVGLGIGQPAAHRRWKICQFKMRDVSVPVSVLCLCPSTYWDVPLFFPLPFFFSFFSSLRVMPCGLAGAGADRSRVLVQDPHEKRKSHHIEKESTRANLLALYARNGRTMCVWPSCLCAPPAPASPVVYACFSLQARLRFSLGRSPLHSVGRPGRVRACAKIGWHEHPAHADVHRSGSAIGDSAARLWAVPGRSGPQRLQFAARAREWNGV